MAKIDERESLTASVESDDATPEWWPAPPDEDPEDVPAAAQSDSDFDRSLRTKIAYTRYKHVVDRAVEVFGDEIAASTWLSTPSPDFNNKPPLQVAQEHGYDPEVLEPVLVRIEHGVYF